MKRITETEKKSEKGINERIIRDERIIYNSYKDLENFQGPYSDPFDIHVHRFDNALKLCPICNISLNNTEISTTSITNAYELDNKYLQEHLKALKISDSGQVIKKGTCYIKY